MVRLNIKTLVKKIVHINIAVLFVLTTFLSSGFMLIIQNEQAGAIAVRGTSTGFVASANSGFSVTTPTNTATGDLLVLFMHHGSGNQDIQTDWGQSGSNWTFERAEALDPGTSNESASVWYRTATAGDAGGSGSYTFTPTGTNDALRWVIVAVEDHNGFDASEGYNDTDVTTSPSVSDTITPTEDGALLLAFLAKDDNDGQTSASWSNVQTMTTEESHNNEGSVLYTSVFSETLSGTSAVTRDFNLTGTNIDGTAKQIMVTINPAVAASSTNVVPTLTQEGYIFENDDGINADSNSQQAAGNTSIEGVRKGEMVNLRMQLSNSEAALDSELGLFYQKDGGFWTQVKHGESSSSAQIDLTDGLVGHWEFDGDATDSTSFGNDGTISGNVTLTTDRFGSADSAYSFDGSLSSYIDTTNQTGYDEFSISAWVYNTDGTTGDVRTIVSNSRDCGAPGCGTTNRGFNMSGTYFDDEPRFAIFDSSNGVIYGAGNVNGAGTTVNDWIHYTGTYDGSTLKIYRNGALYDSTAFSQSSMGTPSAPIRIGNLGLRNDYPWLGKIDDVRYYNRAITPSEINFLSESDIDCTDTEWSCDTIDNAMGHTRGMNAAVDPSTGLPWVIWEAIDGDLTVGRYVEKDGNGCRGGNVKWSCEEIDINLGKQASIAFGPNGKAWVSYGGGGQDLFVAEFVGSGGTGCSAGTTAWTCTELYDGDIESTDIAVDDTGKVWVSAVNEIAGDVIVAELVNSGGSGCFSGTVWNCVVVDNDVGTSGTNQSITSIVVDDKNNPNIVYEDDSGVNAELVHAEYVGTSGSGCTSSAWTCTNIALDSNDTNWIDSAVAPDGSLWVSYSQDSDDVLVVANFVGSGGNCDTTKSGSDAWNCTDVDTSGTDTGEGTSISFDPGGQALITYLDVAEGALKYTRHVGSGGSGCSDSAWDGCSILYDDGSTNGRYTATVFDPSGKVWAFFTSVGSNDLQIAVKKMNQYITPANSSVASGTSSLTESHVDMTSVTDSTNRDDADCLAVGGNWNNGLFSSSGLTNLTLPDGSTTVQCSEVTFGISTANAEDGTYKFALAFKDNTKSSKSYWRGVAQIDEYPTMGVIDEPGIRFSKGVTPIFDNCAGTSGNWGCQIVAENGTSIGRYPSISVDGNGIARVAAFQDLADGNNIVAEYVGSGGNCDTLWTTGSDRWECEVLFDGSVVDDGQYTSATINPLTSTPTFAFIGDNASTPELYIAEYVGSGGTGCTNGSTAYNCTLIMEYTINSSWGEGTSIQYNSAGRPSIAVHQSAGRDIWLMNFVGEGGNCDNDYGGSDAWNCEEILTDALIGKSVNLIFDNDNIPWIASVKDETVDELIIAKYVGSGGSGTGCANNDKWQCWSVDSDVSVQADGLAVSMTIDANNKIWASYGDLIAGDIVMKVAQYVGSGGTGCSDTAWTCTTVDSDSGVDIGDISAMGTLSDGSLVVAYRNSGVAGTFNDIRFARYVGSGGTGCVSSAWDGCEVVVAKNGAGRDLSITLDDNSVVWLTWRDETSDELWVAKQHLVNFSMISSPVSNVSNNSNVAKSMDLIYQVTDGRSARTLDNGECGSALANMMGYCGMLENDGSFDSITAAANERPYVAASVGFSTNTEMPLVNWVGRSNIAPNTAGTAGDLQLEIYRYGSTNAWETLASDTVSSNCNTVDCSLSGAASGPPAEYFRLEDGVYWFNIRIYQVESASSMTLRTDELSATITGQRLRTGRMFEGGAARPFVTE